VLARDYIPEPPILVLHQATTNTSFLRIYFSPKQHVFLQYGIEYFSSRAPCIYLPFSSAVYRDFQDLLDNSSRHRRRAFVSSSHDTCIYLTIFSAVYKHFQDLPDYSSRHRRRAFASSSHLQTQPTWDCCEERKRARQALSPPGTRYRAVETNDLPTTTDYPFFRSGIKPTWEDSSNAKGGKWIVRLPKGLATLIGG
jgi:hypothetical protein